MLQKQQTYENDLDFKLGNLELIPKLEPGFLEQVLINVPTGG